MDDMLSERRLRWLGHVIRMDHQRKPRQALHWEVPGFKRGPGRPRTNWRSTVNKDLLMKGIVGEEAEVATQNRSEWRRNVTQCIHLDAGWIKVKVKVKVKVMAGYDQRIRYRYNQTISKSARVKLNYILRMYYRSGTDGRCCILPANASC